MSLLICWSGAFLQNLRPFLLSPNNRSLLSPGGWPCFLPQVILFLSYYIPRTMTNQKKMGDHHDFLRRRFEPDLILYSSPPSPFFFLRSSPILTYPPPEVLASFQPRLAIFFPRVEGIAFSDPCGLFFPLNDLLPFPSIFGLF